MKTDLSVAPAPALTNACIQTGAGRGPVRHRRAHCGFWTLASWLMLLVWMTGAPQSARAGTWTPLANGAPNGVQLMLLLTDGTVMTHDTTLGGVANGGVESGWSRLTPDSHGSYVNGTWSTLTSMHDARLYFSSQVLIDGRVFVAGGEYGVNGSHDANSRTAEIYDPLTNLWTRLPDAGKDYYDSGSEILPNGNVLVAPVISGGTVIFDYLNNSWLPGPNLFRGHDQDEASWVKLADDSILTIDPFGINSERFIPSQNRWINDGVVPTQLYDAFGSEMGAGFLLPNGKAFYLGATGHTAIYTPSGGLTPGVWSAGPDIPGGQGTADAPAAMMTNGKILCAVAPAPSSSIAIFNSPTSFYEYDYTSNSFTQVGAPGGGLTRNYATYITGMLDLPDGNVLYSDFSGQLYEYAPGGTPLAAGKPAINSITPNADGSYHMAGTLLNGISEGAAYGDDNQMSTNYPIVRLTDPSGTVFYARTYNRSSTSVMTGGQVLTTEFTVPGTLPRNLYSLVTTANGISSDPVVFDTRGLSIHNLTVTEGNSGTTLANFSVTLGQASGQPVTVNYTTSDGTALAGSDYQATSGVLTIPAGSTSGTISVPIIGDTVAEPNETFFVDLSNASGAPIFQSHAVGIIINDDNLGTHGGKIAFSRLVSANGQIFVMNADGSKEQNIGNSAFSDIHPNWSADGTQLAFSRVDATSHHQIFIMTAKGAGQTNLSNGTTTNDDYPAWSPSGVKIAFTRQAGAGNTQIYVMNANGSGKTNLSNTFTNNDDYPTWSPDGTQIAFRRRNGAGHSQIFVMNASGSNKTNISNNVADDTEPSWSPDGTRIAFNRNGAIYLMNTDGSNQVSTNAVQDLDPCWSPDGTQLASSHGAGSPQIYTMLPDGSNQVNISNGASSDSHPTWAFGDAVLPQLAINDVSMAEGNSGLTLFQFTVTMSEVTNHPVTVDYATADGTAMAGSDYQATAGTLTIPAGSLVGTVTVPVIGELVIEPDETFTVNLSNSVGADILRAQGTGTIVNDDGPTLTLSIATNPATNPVTFSETGGATAATGTVTRNTDTTLDLVVNMASDTPSRVAVPLTVTIPAGQTSATFPIGAIDNLIADGNQLVTFTASEPGFVSGTAQATVIDNEIPTLTLSLATNPATAPVTFAETAGPNAALATLSRNTPLDLPLVVSLSSNSTRVAPPATVTIPAGQASVAFPVAALDNFIVDGTQTATLTASQTGFLPGTAQAVVTDNDVAGIVVTPTAGLITSKAGAAANFMIVLTSQPVANVTIGVTSSNLAAGTVSTASLTFTPANWNVPQAVTVTGVDDGLATGPVANSAVTAPAVSTDPNYNTRDAADVSLVNNDSHLPTLSLSVSAPTMVEGTSVTATVSRNTPATADLTVNLATTDPARTTVPATVVIPAGHASATFPVGAVDNLIADGAETVTVGAGATGHASAATPIVVTDNDTAALTLTVDHSTFSEKAGAVAATGTIIRNSDLPHDMTVTLSSSDTGAATVAATVVIPGGQQTATFPIAAVDDLLAADSRTVTISAAAAGLGAAANLTVTDTELPTLTLAVSRRGINELDGPAAATGTVTRNTPYGVPLPVQLWTDTAASLHLPDGVTIPAGHGSVTFPIDAVHDNLVTGTQTAHLTVSGNGLADGTAHLTVADVDTPALTLTLNPDHVSEAATGQVASGTVTRNTSIAGPLLVHLSSNNTGKLLVPATVTIPSRAYSVDFWLTPVNNSIADGPVRVTVSATSSGFRAAAAGITVTDDETPAGPGIGGHITVPSLTLDGATVATPLPGVKVSLFSGNVVRDVALTDAAGHYGFSGLPTGRYRVVPTLTNFSMLPAVQDVTLASTPVTANFSSAARAAISGRIARVSGTGTGEVFPNVTVTLRSGAQTWTARTNIRGIYQFTNLPLGTFVMLPGLRGTYWSPRLRQVSLTPTVLTLLHQDFDKAGTDTTAPTAAVTTPRPGRYTVAGQPAVAGGTARDTGGSGLSIITVALARFSSATATNPAGFYNWTGNGFIGSDNALLVEKLASGKSPWTLRGLPTLPTGFYGLRATATDGAANAGRSAWDRFTIGTATAASSVQLSTATATVANNAVQLRFLGALDADSASDASHYTVTVNGRDAAVESAGYNAVTHTVTLPLPADALHAGDQVDVAWSDVADATGGLVTGRSGSVAAR